MDEYVLPNGITITNARRKHSRGVYDTVRLAYGVPLHKDCRYCIGYGGIDDNISRFPEGQFVALDGDLVVGVAMTMRTNRPPYEPSLKWMEQIGDIYIRNHDLNGRWLYGVEMTVRPDYRKMGIGTALYNARFDLVRGLHLRGWYAVGMLMGYHRHSSQMSIREYAWRVQNREIKDPTVTMQMNRGFRAHGLVENYLPDEPDAGNAGMLIYWPNPAYE